MTLPTLSAAAVGKGVRVAVCSGTWNVISTGEAYLRLGRKPKDGATKSNLPIYSVSLQLRPLSWAGDIETFPGTDEDLTRMLESGKISFDIPIWGLTAQDLASIYTQAIALGAERDVLNTIDLEPTELESKDGTRKLTVYDVRPWLKLTEGAIINNVPVEESNGWTNVARSVRSLVASA